MKTLWEFGVNEVCVGYPYYISQDSGNEYNTNVWWFRKLIKWLSEVLEEYGIKLNIIIEYGTSKQCSVCGNIHENGRICRGLYMCRTYNITINADVNASLNISKRLSYKLQLPTFHTN